MKFRSCTFLPSLCAGLAFFLPSAASSVVVYDWVTVGNEGNPAEVFSGFGSVGYGYAIGKYEVTNAQYTEFLNTVDPIGANPNGIYNSNMGSNVRGGIAFDPLAANGSKYSTKANMDNKPVNFVNWYDAARFANWMNNGQGAGDTETGSYTLTGNTGLPVRNSGQNIWLPSEDEWFKAAYNGPMFTYSLYPTGSNSGPTVSSANLTGDIANPGTNVANYFSGADWNGQDGNVTTVGSAGVGSASYYGTFDQGGNVWEWNEAIISSSRGLRGGSWGSNVTDLQSYTRPFSSPANENDFIGFRLASVPEPSSVLMAGVGGMALLTRRRRSTR
jgi:formylglycine-generating enzyme required for sulfatase activity